VGWDTWIRTVEIEPAVDASEALARERSIETLLRSGCRIVHLNAGDLGMRQAADAVDALAPLVHRYDGVLDVHAPPGELRELALAGADSITFDAGSFYDVPAAIARVRELPVAVGVAYGGWVPDEEVAAGAATADLVLCSGSDGAAARVTRLSRLLPHTVTIQVEGEVSFDNARPLYLAGARALVADRTIFHREDLPRAYRRLVQALT
jgi:pentose-5-phosphate-3-epimerase